LENHISQVTVGGIVITGRSNDPKITLLMPTIAVVIDNRCEQIHQTPGTLFDRIESITLEVEPSRKAVAGAFSYDQAARTGTFSPSVALEPNMTYRISCRAVVAAGTSGMAIDRDDSRHFTTESSPGIELILTRSSARKTVIKTCCTMGAGSYEALITTCRGEGLVGAEEQLSLHIQFPSGAFSTIRNDTEMRSLQPRDIIIVQGPGDQALQVPSARAPVVGGAVTCPIVPRRDIVIGALIGAGSFSSVSLATWKCTTVALKCLRSTSAVTAAAMESEIGILQSMHHPRIISMLAVCKDMRDGEGSAGLLMEHMPNGSLHDVLHSDDAAGTFKLRMLAEKLQVAVDICDGMRFLHDTNLAHRDFKSANVLVDADGRAKISDFGLSAYYQASMTHMTNATGTAAWSAPEVLMGDPVRPPADVYSAGVVLWEIFTGKTPWEGKSVVQIISLVGVQRRKLDIPVSSPNCPQAVIDLLGRCFADADSRPTFHEMHGVLHALLVAENERAKDVPDCFLCPLTFEIMQDPVVMADGQSYERAAIEEWLARSDRSPMTNAVLPHRNAIPNVALRHAIQGYLDTRRRK
jgi:hypothetical protein